MECTEWAEWAEWAQWAGPPFLCCTCQVFIQADSEQTGHSSRRWFSRWFPCCPAFLPWLPHITSLHSSPTSLAFSSSPLIWPRTSLSFALLSSFPSFCSSLLVSFCHSLYFYLPSPTQAQGKGTRVPHPTELHGVRSLVSRISNPEIRASICICPAVHPSFHWNMSCSAQP